MTDLQTQVYEVLRSLIDIYGGEITVQHAGILADAVMQVLREQEPVAETLAVGFRPLGDWDQVGPGVLLYAQPTPPSVPAGYPHKWDGAGERCLKCGDKDWMGGPCSVSDNKATAAPKPGEME